MRHRLQLAAETGFRRPAIAPLDEGSSRVFIGVVPGIEVALELDVIVDGNKPPQTSHPPKPKQSRFL